MATSIPEGGISLRGAGNGSDELKSGWSNAILFKLSSDVLQDLKKAHHAHDGLSFSTGSSPKLRIGDRTIDLSISADAFRNELYASTTGISATDLTFKSVVSHRAVVRTSERKSNGQTAGPDAALAALQSSLASYEQEKQAKQTTITNSILPPPRNRFDAAMKEKFNKNRSFLNANSQPASPSLSATATPRLGPAPTSVPTSEEAVKLQAMKTSVIHLLAMGPFKSEEIMKRTHIPKDELENILHKVGRQVSGEWILTDRYYKDLDIFWFEYPSEAKRQKAVDNAVKAFDRMRLGKDDKLWQMLLPKKDRGKGTVLSRLHLGGGQMNAGLTPNYQPSPMPHLDGTADHKLASAANTPHLGATTPRPGSSKGDVMKRLLSKDPKKARAAEDAKEKKRKEREAAASDREGGPSAKKQATKKPTANVKSAEFVHSSDEESDAGEVVKRNSSQPKASKANAGIPTNPRPKAVKASSSDSSDIPIKSKKDAQKPAVKAKSSAQAAPSSTDKAAKPTATVAGKSTPQKATTTGLSAPESQHKSSQRSPRPSDSRPNVPSPLGAARPRVASDVAERLAIGVQKAKQGAETPKGLGISDGTRKRHDTVTSTGSASSNGSEEKQVKSTPSEKQHKPTMNGMDAANQKPNGSTKRKAEDSTAQNATKHTKADSDVSQVPKSQPTSNGTLRSNGTTQTPALLNTDDNNTNNAADVIDTLTFSQGVNMAEKFQDVYYPAYANLYDELEAKQARGEKISSEEMERFMAMHTRIEQIKAEIKVSSERGGGEE